MNAAYIVCLLIGAVICAGLFAWKLKQYHLPMHTALAGLPLAAVLGLIAAKAGYFLLELRDQWARYGIAGLWTDRPSEFSFVCGAMGVVLAVALTARLLHQPVLRTLDAFAPCGALMAAFTRACEGLLDPMSLVGMGDFVENEALWFFPVAAENQMLYSWFYAVFMLEAACALIVAVAAFVRSRKGGFAPGRVFLHTAFFLALPQIFCERLLNQCMKWGFVRIEQLLCAVIVFVIILYACIRCRGGIKAFWPAMLCLVCVAVLIWMEFTLDNKLLFGIDLPTSVCYGLMIAALGCMAALSMIAYRKLNKSQQ